MGAQGGRASVGERLSGRKVLLSLNAKENLVVSRAKTAVQAGEWHRQTPRGIPKELLDEGEPRASWIHP